MALDFHNKKTNEHLFGLDDIQFKQLEEVFNLFEKRYGISMDYYSDTDLSLKYGHLIQLIDDVLKRKDWNMERESVKTLLRFQTLLDYFHGKKVELQTYCD